MPWSRARSDAPACPGGGSANPGNHRNSGSPIPGHRTYLRNANCPVVVDALRLREPVEDHLPQSGTSHTPPAYREFYQSAVRLCGRARGATGQQRRRRVPYLVSRRKISGGAHSEQGKETMIASAFLFGTRRARRLNPPQTCRELLVSHQGSTGQPSCLFATRVFQPSF